MTQTEFSSKGFTLDKNLSDSDPALGLVQHQMSSLMIVIDQTKQFKQLQLTQRYQRQTRQLATYLITALFIDPNGRQLSVLITPDHPIDNTELVLNWVRQQICCASCLLDADFKELQRDFVRWLLDHDIPAGELQ